jgi:BirA family biotin operon repressor/biotin-[acetyl-CoA-carboxylase] ligase
MTFSLGPRAASEGYRLVAFDRIGSTNAAAMAQARGGEPGPMWFVTSEQTAGRGRRHRPWISPRGNLASSILEVIEASPSTTATLGFAAGLALEAALRKVSGGASPRSAGSDHMTFSLKWPNDLLAGRRKLAGILLEAEVTAGDRLAVVVGIGTNVVAAPAGTPTPATSLAALGVQVNAEQLFTELSDCWANYRAIWDCGRGFGEIRRLWLARAAGLGQEVAIQSGGSTQNGIFETIDEMGCMIIRTSGGKQVSISAGDVYFGSAASAGAS